MRDILKGNFLVKYTVLVVLRLEAHCPCALWCLYGDHSSRSKEGPMALVQRLQPACPAAKGTACTSLTIESHAQVSHSLTGCKVAFCCRSLCSFTGSHSRGERLCLLSTCGNNQPVIKIWEECLGSSIDSATTPHNIREAWEIVNNKTLILTLLATSVCIHVHVNHFSSWKQTNPCWQKPTKHLFKQHQKVQDF